MRPTARLVSPVTGLGSLLLLAGCHHGTTAARPGTSLRTGNPSAAAASFASPVTPPLAALDVADGAAIAVADLDQDGRQDLVVRSGTRLRLFLHTGRGQFREQTDATLAGVTAGAVAFADADRDGVLDLVVGGAQGQADQVLRNDGTGHFTPAPLLLPATSGLAEATAMLVGDVDRDGVPDLVIARRRSPVQLYLGLAAGGFLDTRFRRLPGGTPAAQALAFVDLDRDGDLDLLIGTEAPETALLWENDGQGFFRDRSTRLPLDQSDVRAAAVLDLDQDGAPDLVLARGDGVRVWHNDGTGTLLDVTSDRVLGNPGAATDLTLADLDGDGDLDVVVSGPAVLVNNGQGRLVRDAAREPAGLQATRVLALRLDQDPLPDLVAVTAAQVLLLRNQGGGFRPTAPGLGLPADVTGADATAAAVADLDRDGIADLVLASAGVVTVLLGNGGGGFRALADAVPAALTAQALTLADVDGDQIPDLVLANLWLHNDGTGRFVTTHALPAPLQVLAIAAGDVDGDGAVDLVLASATGTRLLHNDGFGTFTDQSDRLPGPTASAALVLADLDRDGRLDLFLGGDPAGGLPRLLLQGASGFVDHSDRLPAGLRTAFAVAAADLDGDGDLDLVCGISGVESDNRFAQVLLGDGTGAFLLRDELSGTLPGGATTRSVALADLDGDQRPELIALLTEGGAERVARAGVTVVGRNAGLGRFEVFPGEVMGVDAEHGSPAVLLATDLDLDGDADLLVGYQRFATGGGPASTQMRFNLLRQLLADSQPLRGTDLQLRAVFRAGRAPASVFALPFLALRGIVVPAPPFGTWLLDAVGLTALPVVALDTPGGSGRLALPVPDDARLLGLTLHLQAVLLSLTDGKVELSNAVVEPVR